MDESLDDHQKQTIRAALVKTARELIGVPYVYGAEWTDFSKKPEALDCSEMMEGIFKINGLKMPDGSQAQFGFCLQPLVYSDGDLAFFGKGGSPLKIYHSGIVWNGVIIEARAHDPKASFETGKVITRPIEKWVKFVNFCGFRSQPKLI